MGGASLLKTGFTPPFGRVGAERIAALPPRVEGGRGFEEADGPTGGDIAGGLL